MRPANRHVTKLQRIFALFAVLFMAAVANAAGSANNPGYLTLATPQPTSGEKVEVIEVFNYACIHCSEFQPYVDTWAKQVDKSAVQFTYLPAPFNPLFKLMARGYYAADSLGVSANTHHRVFKALFESGFKVNNLDTLADLYASLGVNRDSFLKAAQSFFVESQVRRADDLIRAYEIDGTPTVIVAGKYRVTGETAGGHDKVFAVVDQLIAKEKKSTKSASK